MKVDKYVFGMYVIAVVAILQGIAWLFNKNGAVFAFTSAVIGGVAGVILGIKLTIDKNTQTPPSKPETPTK